jgi:uncharacterized protein (TIGR02246 family)
VHSHEHSAKGPGGVTPRQRPWAVNIGASNYTILVKRRILLLLLIAAFAKLPVSGEESSDEQAIRDLVRQYVDAREHADAGAIEPLFTKDADQLVSTGEWRKGRDAVVEGTVQSSRNTRGTRSISVESIRFLRPDVAIAEGPYQIRGSQESSSRSMWTTLIVTRDSGHWHIAAIRNMLPAPAQPKSNP